MYPQQEEYDILERLKHPEREAERRRRPSRLLFIRNILNATFILIAIIAMAGIALSSSPATTHLFYAIGLLAVIIKGIEVALRMPGMTHKAPRHERRNNQA